MIVDLWKKKLSYPVFYMRNQKAIVILDVDFYIIIKALKTMNL